MNTVEQLLKDPDIRITDEALSTILGHSFRAWNVFVEKLSDYDVTVEWRYYKDGGWLAKCTHKKKNIIWASVSEGFFSTSFNFPEKPHLRVGVQELNISDDIKKSITSTPKGTLFGVTINVYNENQLSDVYKLIDYKKCQVAVR